MLAICLGVDDGNLAANKPLGSTLRHPGKRLLGSVAEAERVPERCAEDGHGGRDAEYERRPNLVSHRTTLLPF